MQQSNGKNSIRTFFISCVVLILITFCSGYAWSGANLLIITPEEFKEALMPLKDWKESTGRHTIIDTLEAIDSDYSGRDLPEKVKKCIYIREDRSGVKYVMLVGDVDKFPVRYIFHWKPCDDGKLNCGQYDISDLYYADLYNDDGSFDDWDKNNNGLYGEYQDFDPVNIDSVDVLPDVYVGRVPASTIEEVTNYVNKIITYEYNMANYGGGEWFKKALFIAEGEFDEEKERRQDVNDGLICAEYTAGLWENSSSSREAIRFYHPDIWNIPADIASLNDAPANWQSLGQNGKAALINQVINDGVGYVIFHGHGNLDNWGGFYYDNHLANLNNSDRLPIMIANACLTAKFAPVTAKPDCYLTTNFSGTCIHGKCFPPEPNPLQPGIIKECFAEEALVKRGQNGAIAYIGVVGFGNKQGKDITNFFTESWIELEDSYGMGHITLGMIWKRMIKKYMDKYWSQLPDMPEHWQTGLTFYYPQKNVLFGDPSLRIGGASPVIRHSNSLYADFNGDGYNDLAIGIPGEKIGTVNNAGMVEVIYGSSIGLSRTKWQFLHQNSYMIDDKCEKDDYFGIGLAAGDFNGDGYSDLAVGVPGEDFTSTDEGIVNVIYGSSDGLSWLGNHKLYLPYSLLGKANYFFGSALTVGDFDGDGYTDLAIGAPGADILNMSTLNPFDQIINSGSVYISYGSSRGLDTDYMFISQNTPGILNPSEDGDYFGAALAAADFNDDGYADLAIGAPGEDIDSIKEAGHVNILYGSSGGLSTDGDQVWHQNISGVLNSSEDGDFFGAALTVGDFNGDGYADLAIGVPGEDLGTIFNAGLVNVLYGNSCGLSPNGDQVWHQNISGVLNPSEDGDFFGAALTANDFNGDGYDDLAIGAPGEDIDSIKEAGLVNVLYGSSGGLSADGDQVWHQNISGVLGTSEDGDLFGAALTAGDFDGDGYSDLAIGVPGEGIGTIYDAGLVNILYGYHSGLTANCDQILYQPSSGQGYVSEGGDHFGQLGVGLSSFWRGTGNYTNPASTEQTNINTQTIELIPDWNWVSFPPSNEQTNINTQNIELIPGWNWVSFNVLPDDTSLGSFFGDHANLIEQVKTQTRSVTNVPGLGWIGDDLNIMSNISKGAMFKIKTRAETPFTLSVTGMRVPTNMTIELQQNWTWIAYLPYPDCLSVNEAMANVLDDLYQVKSQTASKTKLQNGTLIGDLTYINPGQGIVVKMNAPRSLTYPTP